ncbi:MAG: hypothetical protein V8Q79_10120 [Christensenellales bacterium]
MQALNNTLALSLLVVALLLLPVVLFFASRMAKPIANMRAVALTMAGGDLSPCRQPSQRRIRRTGSGAQLPFQRTGQHHFLA